MNKLSKSEYELMEFIWQESSSICIQDLIKHFSDRKTWKRTTIQTFLKRLIDKGYVVVYNEGRNYYYKATLTKAEFTQENINETMKKLYGHSLEGVIASFCGVNTESKNINLIKEFLKELESNDKK